MSESLHTPGPWFVPSKSHGTLYVEARIGGGMLQEVAAVGPTQEWGQQAANARLIAAAPDLLEALQQTLALAIVKFGNLDSDANKVFGQAQAAISRITGETP